MTNNTVKIGNYESVYYCLREISSEVHVEPQFGFYMSVIELCHMIHELNSASYDRVSVLVLDFGVRLQWMKCHDDGLFTQALLRVLATKVGAGKRRVIL